VPKTPATALRVDCKVADVGWRDIGNAAMAPTLEPEQLVYDIEQGVMYFSGIAGGMPVRCGIAVAVLVALEGSRQRDWR
jgi:hypothetical protein